ncbi:MAG: 50S ribosomal protein L9 [Alphaproteobacteria bacterium]
MSTQVILLERVGKLGNLGDIVNVKPGYARNYLLPQKKALRASKANIAYFEAQKKVLIAENDKQKAEAEKQAKKIEGTKVPIIRQASESGQLFGSVAARDIVAALNEAIKGSVDKSAVRLKENIKTIGLIPVDLILHPEVKAEIIVNIARSPEEAEIQAETGRALVADAAYDDAEEEAEVEVEAQDDAATDADVTEENSEEDAAA